MALGLELGDRGLDLGLLPLEMRELIVDLLSRQPQLRRPFAALGALQKALNLGEREAELLALEDELEPRPLSTVVEARGAGALGLEKAAILVEAQRPQRDAEFPGEVADGVAAAAPRLSAARRSRPRRPRRVGFPFFPSLLFRRRPCTFAVEPMRPAILRPQLAGLARPGE